MLRKGRASPPAAESHLPKHRPVLNPPPPLVVWQTGFSSFLGCWGTPFKLLVRVSPRKLSWLLHPEPIVFIASRQQQLLPWLSSCP